MLSINLLCPQKLECYIANFSYKWSDSVRVEQNADFRFLENNNSSFFVSEIKTKLQGEEHLAP